MSIETPDPEMGLDAALDALSGGAAVAPRQLDEDDAALAHVAARLRASAEVDWPAPDFGGRLAASSRESQPRRAPRNRVIGAGAVVLVALGGGVLLGGHLPVAAPTAANPGGSPYFVVPLGPGAGSAAAPGAASKGAAANSFSVAGDGVSQATNAYSPMFYGYNDCSPQPAHISGNYITATAMGQIAAGSTSGFAIYISFNDQNSTLNAIRDKVDGLKKTIAGMGVPVSSISTSVGSYYYSPGAGNRWANGNLTVGVADAGLANQIEDAASNAGAQSVSVNGQPSTTAPSNEEVNAAAASAISQAHNLAVTAAANAGAGIGKLHSTEILPPMTCWDNGQSVSVVEVILSYDLKA